MHKHFVADLRQCPTGQGNVRPVRLGSVASLTSGFTFTPVTASASASEGSIRLGPLPVALVVVAYLELVTFNSYAGATATPTTQRRQFGELFLPYLFLSPRGQHEVRTFL